MKRVTHFLGAITLLGGLLYSLDSFIAGEYEVEQRRGADVIYDRNGGIYVQSDPENMLIYLKGEDPDRLRHCLSKLEEEVENAVR